MSAEFVASRCYTDQRSYPETVSSRDTNRLFPEEICK